MEDKVDYMSMLMHHTPAALYVKDLSAQVFDFVNPAISKLTGLSPADFLKLTPEQFIDLIHPDDREYFINGYTAFVKASLASDDDLHLQYRFKHTSGTYVQIIDHCTVRPGADGKADKLLGSLDHMPAQLSKPTGPAITDEGSVPEVSRDFRQIADKIYEGIWQIDKEDTTVYVNPRMAGMLGYQPADMLGRSLFDFMEEEAKIEAQRYLRQRNDGQCEQHEFTFLHRNGSNVYTYLACSPVHDPEGNYIGAIAAVSDISALKKAQKELQEQEELMRDTADNLPGLIMTYLLRPDGSDRILFISQGVKDLYEVLAEGAMKDPSLIWERIHKEDVKKVKHLVQESADRLSPLYVEFRVRMPDGRLKWLCERGMPRKMPDGSTLWNTLTLEETARITAEQNLRESESRLALVLKGSNDVYWDYDLVRNTIFYSERWWRMFGYQASELLPEEINWKERVHPGDLPRVEKTIHNAIENGRDSYEVESRRLHKKGHNIPVLERGLITRDAEGKPSRISGTLFDLSKIKAAEKKIRESELKFRTLIEGVNSVIYTFNHHFEFTYVSPAAVQSLGYPPEALKNKSPFDLIYHEDLEGFRSAIHQMVQSRQKRSDIEYRVIKKDGSISWRSGAMTPFLNEDGEITGYLGISYDIDELKQKEAKLAEAIAMKDKLFSIIGHDLKSPLNSILGLTEIMADNVQRGEVEEVKELFGWVRKASQKSVDLLSNLLEWARSQSGDLHFAPKAEKVLPLFEFSRDMIEEAAAEKRLGIHLKVDPALQVLADANMLRTILRNLLSNAVKYTREAGWIQLSALRHGLEVLFSVEDNGVGIPADDIDKIFAPDKPHTTPGTKQEKGTGLGLLLCKDFVERQGGHIWVESAPDRGTSFFFTLPAVEQEGALSKNPAPGPGR